VEELTHALKERDSEMAEAIKSAEEKASNRYAKVSKET
jgi:hypothetical protein